MGLLEWLFGSREPAAKATTLGFSFGADGSQTIHIGGQALTLNKPVSDDDGRKRSSDGRAIARRLIKTLAADAGELEDPAFPFVDAVLLAARAGDRLPAIKNPRRRKLAEMCAAAAAHDADQVIELARGDDDLESYVVHLVFPFAPRAAATFAIHSLAVLRALAPVDRAAADAMLAAMPEHMLGDATLAALDAGLDAAPLHARWPSLDGMSAEDAHPWRALEVRRLSRTDIDAAFERERELPQLWSHDEDASLAVAARLAAADPDRAIARADELGPDCRHLSWLDGCVRGAPDRAGALVDRWIDDLSPSTYDPYRYFRGVLEACVRLGDAARVRRLCERGGPTGWQIAHAARWQLGRAPNRRELLEACLARYPAGCVAGRAVDRPMMAVGKVVIRPAWLRLTDPHPVETLSIVAALGPDGPDWGDEALP